MLRSSNSSWGWNLSLFSWYFSAVYIQHWLSRVWPQVSRLHRLLTLCGCHVPERQPHEVLILPQGKSHSCQLQYLEMLFKKEQWSGKSDPKAFLLEESTCSESDPSFPSPKKGKDWRSSKPVSIASSSDTCSRSHRVRSANQTTQSAKTISLGCLTCLPRRQHFLRGGFAIWVYPDCSVVFPEGCLW